VSKNVKSWILKECSKKKKYSPDGHFSDFLIHTRNVWLGNSKLEQILFSVWFLKRIQNTKDGKDENVKKMKMKNNKMKKGKMKK